MSQFGDYNQKLVQLISDPPGDSFSVELLALLQTLVPIDDATVVLYPSNGLPVIDYFQPLEDGSTLIDDFVKAAFLLDPYYTAARDGRFGFFRLKELTPDSFRKSEYYRTFYSQSAYQDEVGYLVPIATNSFVNISLAKTSEPSRFSEKQIAVLADLEPVVSLLCRQRWGSEGSKSHGSDFSEGSEPNEDIAAKEESSEINLRDQLDSALQCFGSSLLTEREVQVINRVLHGHSTRMVADRLNISIETVKLHRKHAYAKLGIGSQAELFHLFLDSLMSAEDYTEGGALEQYFRVPRP